MNCEAAQAELKAYQDGELDRLSAWRVRRHVEHCAPCTEEVRMMGKLNALLLSADLVKREAPATGRSLSAASAPQSASPAWRSRRVQWASAGAAVLAAVFLAFGTTGRTDALAAAMHALAQMRSWTSCHLITQSRGGWTSEQWVRIPYDVHEERRQNGGLYSITVQNARESWLYRADKNLVVHSHAKLMAPLNGSTVGTVVGPLYDLGRLQQEARRVGGLSIHERQDRMPDGRPVRVIDLQIDEAKHYSREPGAPPLKIQHNVIYLDALTEQLLRWDAVNDGASYKILAYHQAPPDTLFTWQPPAGVKVVEFPDWWETRKGQKLAAAASQEWDVTVHAVDVSANGDVWLTASEKPRAHEAGGAGPSFSSRWSAYGMTLTDERGRIYVQFMAEGADDWPDGTLLIGFTPLEPRHPRDPLPFRLTATLWPDYGSSQGSVHRRQTVTVTGLAAPAPAGWVSPPINPADAIPSASAGWGPLCADRKARARKGYREGNAW
jgi:hypothetical protein